MKILGTRKAVQDALAYAYTADSSMAEYLTYLCRVDKTRKTGIEQNVMAIQFAKIRAAINDQRQPIPAWLHFAYGPDLECAQKGRQKRTLGLMLSHRLYTSPISTKRRDRIERLCMCAAEDYRMGLFMGKILPQTEYATAMEVRDDNFQRDWAKTRDRVLEMIKRLDSEGLGYVSVTVREIRESEEHIA